jgi:hypothetical protein
VPQTETISFNRTSVRAVKACEDGSVACSALMLTSLIVGVLLTLLARAGWMSLI